MAARKTTSGRSGSGASRPKAKAGSARAKQAAQKKARAKRSLAPSRTKRGLEATEVALSSDDPAVAALAEEIRAAGGAVLCAYREPLAGAPLVLASLPLAAIEPTPFQRDLSPTHVKRLAQKIEESGSFLDPLIVVRGDDGRLWTPNGRHRLAAAKVLGQKQITALVSPDEALSFKILALNTEKAHNLKDRSLEVIRMARALAKARPRAKESDFANEFESAELLTLGIVYERQGRFAGAAYGPFLKKVDRFSSKTLAASLREREGWASRLEEINAEVGRIVEGLQARGFKSPYLRTYVVARINPVRFHRARRGDDAPAMPIASALTRMAAAAKKFDVATVKQGDLALVAAVAADED
ncbi:MAG: ParB N-terminal domain-containing protein [Spirochaetaceae bacterium]|nr:ParB N-terminal domain-containing protein [Myxococcales bacterium]MCB9724738.1 ParB N-terminal domain-containing protein [Spirochaetaceae bacterium]HPG24690.1 ParB/RepB/Spo0J family partition protein [Myxococcota bacterium]